jgi:hypothetical protein
MEAVRTSETSVDNYFTRQYIPEDNSEQLITYCNVYIKCTIAYISFISCFFGTYTIVGLVVKFVVFSSTNKLQ